MKLLKFYLLAWAFPLFIATLPFHWRYNNIVIGLLLVACLLQKGFWQRLKDLLANSIFWGVTAIFWTDALSCLYSDNLDEAFFTLEKRLSIVLMPLLLGSLPSDFFTPHKVNQLLQVFVGAVSAALLVCLGDAVIAQNAVGWANINVELFMYHGFTNIIGVHSIYIAQYTAFSVGIILYLTSSTEISFKRKLGYGIVGIFLYVFLFLLANRITILAFHLIVVGHGIYLVFVKPRLLPAIAALLLLMIGMLYAIYTTNSFFRERAQEVVVSLSSSEQAHGNTGVRLNILKCSREVLLAHHNWLTGFGVGDSQEQLNACYAQYAWGNELTNAGEHDGPNAHNQYIQETLNKGLIGLLAWVLFLAIPFIKVYSHQKNMLFVYLVFWGCFAMLAFAESPLNMNKGIVYCSFFQSLFLVQSVASFKAKAP